MKRILLAMLVGFLGLACGGRSDAETPQKESEQVKDCVEVIYFHGKQRCVTCKAIEKNTKELLETKFAEQMKDGRVVMTIVDFSQKENEKIAEKYQVTWSSIFVVQHKNGKEKAENMTEFAFGNARVAPDKFKTGVEVKINQMLK